MFLELQDPARVQNPNFVADGERIRAVSSPEAVNRTLYAMAQVGNNRARSNVIPSAVVFDETQERPVEWCVIERIRMNFSCGWVLRYDPNHRFFRYRVNPNGAVSLSDDLGRVEEMTRAGFSEHLRVVAVERIPEHELQTNAAPTKRKRDKNNA
jgi:hypothetical protein